MALHDFNAAVLHLPDKQKMAPVAVGTYCGIRHSFRGLAVDCVPDNPAEMFFPDARAFVHLHTVIIGQNVSEAVLS